MQTGLKPKGWTLLYLALFFQGSPPCSSHGIKIWTKGRKKTSRGTGSRTDNSRYTCQANVRKLFKERKKRVTQPPKVPVGSSNSPLHLVWAKTLSPYDAWSRLGFGRVIAAEQIRPKLLTTT